MTKQTATQVTLRNRCCDNQRWGVTNRSQIGYIEQRPMAMPALHALPFQTDCSGWVTTVCRWSGAPDPSGPSYAQKGIYSPYGNSDTIDVYCETIELADTEWGDLIVYGPSGATIHVAMLVQSGSKVTDPLVISHGTPSGPEQLPVSAEIKSFGTQPYRFKRLPV